MAKKIKATANQVGNTIVIEAQVVEDGKVILAETFTWGADVPRAAIARETRLLLKDRLAGQQPAPVTISGLDGTTL